MSYSFRERKGPGLLQVAVESLCVFVLVSFFLFVALLWARNTAFYITVGTVAALAPAVWAGIRMRPGAAASAPLFKRVAGYFIRGIAAAILVFGPVFLLAFAWGLVGSSGEGPSGAFFVALFAVFAALILAVVVTLTGTMKEVVRGRARRKQPELGSGASHTKNGA